MPDDDFTPGIVEFHQKRLTELTRRGSVRPDPDYDFVPPLPPPGNVWGGKKGTQCGECGMKFEYGTAYGFCCSNTRCPTGWNGR